METWLYSVAGYILSEHNNLGNHASLRVFAKKKYFSKKIYSFSEFDSVFLCDD